MGASAHLPISAVPRVLGYKVCDVQRSGPQWSRMGFLKNSSELAASIQKILQRHKCLSKHQKVEICNKPFLKYVINLDGEVEEQIFRTSSCVLIIPALWMEV